MEELGYSAGSSHVEHVANFDFRHLHPLQFPFQRP